MSDDITNLDAGLFKPYMETVGPINYIHIGQIYPKIKNDKQLDDLQFRAIINAYSKPELINGSLASDDRGSLRFINAFSFHDVNIKRFYQVDNNAVCHVRAWHGHCLESKFCYCVKGSAIIATAPLSTVKGTVFDKIEGASRIVLSSFHPQILHIPAGNYNGFRTLEPGSILQFFSTSTLEQSKNDDVRLPADAFGAKVWEVESR